VLANVAISCRQGFHLATKYLMMYDLKLTFQIRPALAVKCMAWLYNFLLLETVTKKLKTSILRNQKSSESVIFSSFFLLLILC
jgi:hypothetical protein